MGGCNVLAVLNMADMVCLECRNCGVHELVCWSKVCCEILFAAEHGRYCLYVERYGVSSAEYSVHLTGVNTLRKST